MYTQFIQLFCISKEAKKYRKERFASFPMHLHHALASQHSIIIIIILGSAQHLSHPTIIRFGLETPAFGKIDIKKNLMETSCASISCQLLVYFYILYDVHQKSALAWHTVTASALAIEAVHKHYKKKSIPLLHPPASQTHQCFIYPPAVSNSVPFKRKFI